MSEFGTGTVYCLVLFANHFNNEGWQSVENHHWQIKGEQPKDAFWFNKIVPIWGSPERALAHDIEIWANGASDHLYELQIPEEEGELKEVLTTLMKKGLRMGHSFDCTMWEIKDLTEVRNLTLKAAMLIDQKLGVLSEKGDYE